MTRWAIVPGWDGMYWASSDGEVKSTRRVLKPTLGTNGYLIVTFSRRGFRKKMPVHRAVLSAFHGTEYGLDACHIDGDKTNNRLENLRWATRSENILDQVRHGTHNNARKTHCPANHPYTEGNTYILAGGRRQCVTCTRARAAGLPIPQEMAS